jgi:hypothetical protein
MTPLTEEQLQALIDGCEGVTPGPWDIISDAPNLVWVCPSNSAGFAGLRVCTAAGDVGGGGVCRCRANTIRALATEVRESRARITDLEETREADKKNLDAWHESAGRHCDRADRAEARIAKLEAALRSIAANTCCDKCQEAALVARAALGREG